MRGLSRNKRTMYYALYEGKTEILDEWGNKTGETAIAYSLPIAFSANVSAARGTAANDQFGVNVVYDRTIVTSDTDCPITETSVLWVDRLPALDANGATETPHDYIVKHVAKSINVATYSISKVSVS